MLTLILFGTLSIPLVVISWRTMFHFRSHGFYRFLSWEMILLLLVFNYPYWFRDPFSISQIISWVLLIISGYLVIAGAIHLKKYGKQENEGKRRDDGELYAFERTSGLVDRGVYKYIRHPLYASLLCFTWGVLFKDAGLIPVMAAILSTLFLWFTAIFDEKECIEYFGEEYRRYMKRSKRFIPFIL